MKGSHRRPKLKGERLTRWEIRDSRKEKGGAEWRRVIRAACEKWGRENR